MTKQRPSILLLDENADTLEQLQTVLQRGGYNVLVAADGNAALRLAKRTKPDLIVSEVLLAGIDGYEVWQMIRADEEIPNVPILVVSALTIPAPGTPWRPNTSAEWRLLSYDAFLSKPVDLRRLTRVVKKLLHPDQAQEIPGGPTITIAIEDTEVQETLATIFCKHDFEVETPASLQDAVKLLSAMPPAVLLMDYRVQNEAVREMMIRTKNTTANTVVILLINPDKELDADWLSHCDGLVPPPFNSNFVVDAVNQALSQCSMDRRTELLSSQLLTTNRNLLDIQHVLQAQNEELQHVNAKLREVDRIKETLTGMVVHDLKTPLAAILGALSFLAGDPDIKLSQVSRSLLTGGMAAGNQMVRLTETLLERQRLEDGHLKPDREPFYFPTVVDVSLKQLSPLVTLHRLTVRPIIPEDIPLVLADPHISQRILENLLDNAIKFSPRNSQITIRLSNEIKFVKVSIEDQGPGIPTEEQMAIFEQFTQLENEERPSARAGFGLGLAFCKLATLAMGGAIWVESDGESGTRFLFTIPVCDEYG